MEKYCYFNNKIVEASKQGLPLDDIGILRGVAIFEYFRTYNQKPFRLKDNYERFKNSAKIVGLEVPITFLELEKIVTKLIQKNKLKECAFRMILTGGKSADHITPEGKGVLYILVEKPPMVNPEFVLKGGKLITHEYMRQYPEAKTSCYIEASKLQGKLKKAGAQEILFYSNDIAYECSKSNFLIIKNGQLISPKKSILGGITRKITIEIAKANKIRVAERDIKLDEIWQADEALITSSGSAKIMPITKIDGKKIGNGKVGPICQLLAEEFHKITNSN